jgi:hypothetical protein
MFAPRIGASYEVKKHRVIDVATMFASKLMYYFMFIVLPMILLDFAWWQVLIGFVTLHVAEGFTLAIVFQLAHVVEEASFPLPDEKVPDPPAGILVGLPEQENVPLFNTKVICPVCVPELYVTVNVPLYVASSMVVFSFLQPEMNVAKVKMVKSKEIVFIFLVFVNVKCQFNQNLRCFGTVEIVDSNVHLKSKISKNLYH